jgi:serine/threonine protein kinase
MVTQVLGDRYEIQQQLGKRAGRRTLLARDIITQELVVLKLLSFGNDFEWDDLKLFEREAETLKALNHPFIPRYLDFFELNSPTGKKLALVQTYVEGKSLEEHLKAGRTFSEAELKQIASSLLEILIYLHGRIPPVIHRDIKPSNILLHNRSGNSVGEVYLVDFGSVQTLAATEGGTITVVGTYGYMPQEQFGGRTVPASDLYSLGATLIALVTGTHPADLPQKDFRIQFEQASNLNPAMSSWLRWMTEPTLEQRLASADRALQALEQEQLTTDNAPVVVIKPTGSKVLLTRNADSLEILLPPKGFPYKAVFSLDMFQTICWTLLCLFMSSSISFSPVVFTVGTFVLLMLSSFFFNIFCGLFRRVRLRINRQQIYLTYELLGFKYNRPRSAFRQSINKLEYTRRRFKGLGNQVEINPQLIIWAGVQKYALGDKYETNLGSSLTEPELEWLAHELSEWLGMPITREELPLADR